MIVLSWNICGLGNDQSQLALENLCTTHKPDWISLYESKIMFENLPNNFLRRINMVLFASNVRLNSRSNIWIFCKLELQASSMVISSSNQYIAIRNNDTALVFVHASNNYNNHRALWSDLLRIHEPKFCVIGDFNVVLGAHERSSGHLTHATPPEEFRDFISQCDLFDIEGTGNKYTWATRRNNSFMAARLDRALANQGFLSLWDDVELLILPLHCSDHNPLHLRTSLNVPASPRPFRFQDMWTMHESFFDTVKQSWYIPILACTPTVRLITKLKRLRHILKVWNAESFRNIHTEIQQASIKLDQTQ